MATLSAKGTQTGAGLSLCIFNKFRSIKIKQAKVKTGKGNKKKILGKVNHLAAISGLKNGVATEIIPTPSAVNKRHFLAQPTAFSCNSPEVFMINQLAPNRAYPAGRQRATIKANIHPKYPESKPITSLPTITPWDAAAKKLPKKNKKFQTNF